MMNSIKSSELFEFQEQNPHLTQNHGYFPIVLKDEEETLKVKKALNEQQIFPRRYFYPSLDTLSYIEPKTVFAYLKGYI